MGREIKFRAWSKYDKQMTYDVTIYGKGYVELIFPNGDINAYPSLEKAELMETQLMQYTGLKDKNGKEVFEGDIILCSKGCPHEVIWLDEYGGTYFGGMPAWYLSGIYDGYAWTGAEEIIGNKFENPELLEGEKQ